MAWDGFSLRRRKEMPPGVFIKCPGCEQMVYRKAVAERLQVCPECNYHFTISSEERMKLMLALAHSRTLETSYEEAAPLPC